MPHLPKNAEIGKRLRELAARVGGPTELARQLGISPQSLNDYLTGRRGPGNKMQARLQALGFDPIWLITGRTQKDIDEGFDRFVAQGRKDLELTDEEVAMVLSLRRMGIHTWSNMMLSLNEDIVGPPMIAESKRAIVEARRRTNNRHSSESNLRK